MLPRYMIETVVLARGMVACEVWDTANGQVVYFTPDRQETWVARREAAEWVRKKLQEEEAK